MFNQLSEAQLQASQHCSQRIEALIQKQDVIGFDEFMQIALYDSKYGYYQRKDEIFGASGDFTTTPESSGHLAFCLAHAAAKLIKNDPSTVIVEIGAGSGKLCCEILNNLSNLDCLPDRYYIYDASTSLREKQHAFLSQALPDYIAKLHWLEDLSTQLGNVMIIANEVLDALPVKCFQLENKIIQERVITLNDANEFSWELTTASDALSKSIEPIIHALQDPLPDTYQSEINVNLKSCLSSWERVCKQGVLFLVDYGFPQQEYYHSQRHMGTLRSYFKHQVSEDVLLYPGLQDITADVDFTAVANVAEELNMNVLAFSSQRNFMLANNLLEWQPNTNNEVERLAQIAQLKQLTLGSAISERFQVMILAKGIHYETREFTLRDMRARL